MTISYSEDVHTSGTFAFMKLLFRWQASVYKLLWKELLMMVLGFYIVRIIYMYLPDENQEQFESFVTYCKKYGGLIPLSFVLGFFVSFVMTRWWEQFKNIPYPISLGVYVSSGLQGYDEVGRSMRRTIMRYACLSLTLVFRVLSPRVKRRFPKLEDLVKAGLLLHHEMITLENIENKFPGYSKNWLPITWAANIVSRARKEGRIHNDFAANAIIYHLNCFREKAAILLSYHIIQIPLVYVQVVTYVVQIYFIAAIFALQEVKTEKKNYIGFDSLDSHPILISLEFIFYVGWLKVAEALLNPFGMDDDDFDVNSMIDRNLQMSYLIVDDMHDEQPLLLKDPYWDEVPQSLPDRTRDSFPEPEEETDIIEYDVIQRKSIFGRVSVTVRQHKKDDLEWGDDEDIYEDFYGHPSLVPNPNVISNVYRKIPNVELVQNALNQELERAQRVLTGENSRENL